MALPNPTKTNYGNVDDITPVEMNDIGSNLISLGQKILKVVDDTWILTNADHDGTNFIRIDIAKAASALQLGIDGSKTAWNAAAGANPIVWVQGEKWDASGKLVSGAVPFARLFSKFHVSWSGVTNGIINFGALNTGDFVIAHASLGWFEGSTTSATKTGISVSRHFSSTAILTNTVGGVITFETLANEVGYTASATGYFEILTAGNLIISAGKTDSFNPAGVTGDMVAFLYKV